MTVVFRDVLDSKRFDYTIQRSGYSPSTQHDVGSTSMITDVARVLEAVVSANDPEAKISITIRPAKDTLYEVWCSADAGELHETTFTSLDLAKKHADDLWEQERSRYENGSEQTRDFSFMRHYYVKQRRGRGKGVVVYKAYPK